MGEGTRTVSQHDARRQSDGTITIFDNGAPPQVHDAVTRDRGRARHGCDEGHAGAGVHPPRRAALHLPGQHAGAPQRQRLPRLGQPNRSSPSTAKTASCSSTSQFAGETQSYRAFRQPWSGRPAEDPAVAAEKGKGGRSKHLRQLERGHGGDHLAGARRNRTGASSSRSGPSRGRASRRPWRSAPTNRTWPCGPRTTRVGCSATSEAIKPRG